MLPASHGTMLNMVLGLLLLPCLCSAMLPQRRPKENETLPNAWDPQSRHIIMPPGFPGMGNTSFPQPGPAPPRHTFTPPPNFPPPTNFRPTPSDPFTPDESPDMGGVFPMDDNPNQALCDMLLDAPVPPPMDQVPWFCICSRCQATTGGKGDPGDKGDQGMKGSPGRPGLTGFQGRRGFMGPWGDKGQKGDMGEKGQQGMLGYMGTKGARGFKGEKGDLGDLGEKGNVGPQGETGTCPASCEGARGMPGPQGQKGDRGAKGMPGVEGAAGRAGAKGDMGNLGRAGPPGEDGTKGVKGDMGLCNCTNGMPGAKGDTGPTGAKGDKGSIGTPGIQGMTGQKGPEGDMGMMGMRGPCAGQMQSAFTASLRNSFPVPNNPIMFTNIISNVQNHYDPTTGKYRAFVNGTYVMAYYAAVNDRILKVGLFRNFDPVVKTTETTNSATASQQVVLHLNEGDQLWLQVKDEESNGMVAQSESYSTFSGYLLHPDSCELPISRSFGFYEPQVGVYSWEHSPTPSPTTA